MLTLLLAKKSERGFVKILKWLKACGQKCLQRPRAHFKWLAALVSECVVYGQLKPELHFCVTATAVSRCSRCFPSVLWCSKSKYKHEKRRQEMLLLQTLIGMPQDYANLKECRKGLLAYGHFHMIKFGPFRKTFGHLCLKVFVKKRIVIIRQPSSNPRIWNQVKSTNTL